MKFEKFLKSVGAYGHVVEVNESEKWLVCGGVGMIIPRGVETLVGRPLDKDCAELAHVISTAALDEPMTLSRARIDDPAGNASAIYRVFETELGDSVTIINADYGLIEKKDQLGYGEIETDAGDIIKVLVVYGRDDQVQGYITGIRE